MNRSPRGFRCKKCGSPNPSTPHVHPTCFTVEVRTEHNHRMASTVAEGELVVCFGEPEAGTWVPDPEPRSEPTFDGERRGAPDTWPDA